MSDFLNRLRPVAFQLFDLDCEKENLLYKLNEICNKILDLELRVKEQLGYPHATEIHDFASLVLQVTPLEINVYTKDQFEKLP